jgi:hypothetical protein
VSSAIHVATCVARDGASVDLELTPTEAAGACFPFSKFFALALLYEAASTLVMFQGKPLWRSSESPGGPIGTEFSFHDLFDLTDVDTPDEKLLRPPTREQRAALRERKHSLVERFITDVSYVAVKYWQPLLCPLESGGYRRPIALDHARRIEAELTLQDVFDNADESARPSATLRIETTGAKWVSHLDVGMDWDVVMFDNDAGVLV